MARKLIAKRETDTRMIKVYWVSENAEYEAVPFDVRRGAWVKNDWGIYFSDDREDAISTAEAILRE